MIYSVEVRDSPLWDKKEMVNKGVVDQTARHAGLYSSYMSPLSAESSIVSITRTVSHFCFVGWSAPSFEIQVPESTLHSARIHVYFPTLLFKEAMKQTAGISPEGIVKAWDIRGRASHRPNIQLQPAEYY